MGNSPAEDANFCFQLCRDYLKEAMKQLAGNSSVNIKSHIDDATEAVQMAEPYLSDGMPELAIYNSLLKKCDLMFNRYVKA